MNYEVTKDTQIIMPIKKKNSKVIEDEIQFTVKCTPLEIIEHSCEYFGSSFTGRKDGTRKMLGITHKPPIIIEESTKLIFFPTNSPESSNCIWINLERIDRYFKINAKKSEILFKNGNKVQFNVSFGSLTNQILRATRLKFVLDERTKKKYQKKDNF